MYVAVSTQKPTGEFHQQLMSANEAVYLLYYYTVRMFNRIPVSRKHVEKFFLSIYTNKGQK